MPVAELVTDTRVIGKFGIFDSSFAEVKFCNVHPIGGRILQPMTSAGYTHGRQCFFPTKHHQSAICCRIFAIQNKLLQGLNIKRRPTRYICVCARARSPWTSSSVSFPTFMWDRCFSIYPGSLSDKSFLMLSKHLRFGLPLLLFPGTSITITLLPTFSLLDTCPCHFNLPSYTFLDISPTFAEHSPKKLGTFCANPCFNIPVYKL